jgi:hypothetical protein
MYADDEPGFKFDASLGQGGDGSGDIFGDNNMFFSKRLAEGTLLRDNEAIRQMENLEIQQR